jgi:uncharacterized protein YkwD
VVTGWRAGFIATTYGLVSWIAALVIALALQGPVSSLLASATPLPGPIARAAVFVGLLLLVETALAFVGGTFVRPLIFAVHRIRLLAALDRVLGVFPAVGRTLLIAAIGLAALLVLPVGNDVRAAIDGSRAARALVSEIAALQPYLGALATERDGAPLFVTRLGENERQTLDLPDTLALEPDPEAERQMLALVNEERVNVGLAPLELDPRLVPVARAHSSEMFRLKYFGHESPVSGSPFDRISAAGITFHRAGENLAYAHSVAVAHRGLMESPGHRENILRPEFTRIGIGVISAGPYGRMFTQLFLTP